MDSGSSPTSNPAASVPKMPFRDGVRTSWSTPRSGHDAVSSSFPSASEPSRSRALSVGSTSSRRDACREQDLAHLAAVQLLGGCYTIPPEFAASEPPHPGNGAEEYLSRSVPGPGLISYLEIHAHRHSFPSGCMEDVSSPGEVEYQSSSLFKAMSQVSSTSFDGPWSSPCDKSAEKVSSAPPSPTSPSKDLPRYDLLGIGNLERRDWLCISRKSKSRRVLHVTESSQPDESSETPIVKLPTIFVDDGRRSQCTSGSSESQGQQPKFGVVARGTPQQTLGIPRQSLEPASCPDLAQQQSVEGSRAQQQTDLYQSGHPSFSQSMPNSLSCHPVRDSVYRRFKWLGHKLRHPGTSLPVLKTPPGSTLSTSPSERRRRNRETCEVDSSPATPSPLCRSPLSQDNDELASEHEPLDISRGVLHPLAVAPMMIATQEIDRLSLLAIQVSGSSSRKSKVTGRCSSDRSSSPNVPPNSPASVGIKGASPRSPQSPTHSPAPAARDPLPLPTSGGMSTRAIARPATTAVHDGMPVANLRLFKRPRTRSRLSEASIPDGDEPESQQKSEPVFAPAKSASQGCTVDDDGPRLCEVQRLPGSFLPLRATVSCPIIERSSEPLGRDSGRRKSPPTGTGNGACDPSCEAQIPHLVALLEPTLQPAQDAERRQSPPPAATAHTRGFIGARGLRPGSPTLSVVANLDSSPSLTTRRSFNLHAPIIASASFPGLSRAPVHPAPSINLFPIPDTPTPTMQAVRSLPSAPSLESLIISPSSSTSATVTNNSPLHSSPTDTLSSSGSSRDGYFTPEHGDARAEPQRSVRNRSGRRRANLVRSSSTGTVHVMEVLESASESENDSDVTIQPGSGRGGGVAEDENEEAVSSGDLD